MPYLSVQRWCAVLVAVPVLLSLLWPLPAAAQGSGITLSATAGYAGAYRISDWFPVDVQVANDGPDARVTIEWDVPSETGEIFRREVDLPRGARKQVQFAAFTRSYAPVGRVRVLRANQLVAEQQVPIEVVDFERLLIGVISSDPALLNSLASLPARGGAVVRHLDPATLPSQAVLLRGMDTLFINDVDTATFRPEQRDALALWVRLGGTLIVGGGPQAQQTAAGLRDVLPAELSGGLAQGDLAPLSTLVRQSTPPPPATLSALTPRPGAIAIPPQAPQIYRWSLGSGSVLLTSFDLGALTGWDGEIPLWDAQLATAELFAPGTIARQSRASLISNGLQLPALRLPSTATLLLLIAAYVLVIGPLNYLVLRRLGRLEYAWISTPLVVIAFTALFYGIGFGLRGTNVRLSEIAVVEGWEGQPRAVATTSMGVFSPSRSAFSFSLPNGALLSNPETSFNDESVPIVTTDTDVRADEVIVDVGALRTLMSEQEVVLPVGVQSSLQTGGGGTVTNTGTTALADAILVDGARYWELGPIAPGATVTIPTDTGRTFPDGYRPANQDVFRRDRLISTLFDSSRNVRQRTSSATSGTYLIAWSDASVTPVTLSTTPSERDTLTLYVLRLGR